MLLPSKYAVLALLLFTSSVLCKPVESMKNAEQLHNIRPMQRASPSSKDMSPQDFGAPNEEASPLLHKPSTVNGHTPNNDPLQPRKKYVTPAQMKRMKEYQYGTSYGPGGKAMGWVWDGVKWVFRKLSRSVKWLFKTNHKEHQLTNEELEALAKLLERDPNLLDNITKPQPTAHAPHSH